MSAKYVKYENGQLSRVRYCEEVERPWVSQLVEVGTRFIFLTGGSESSFVAVAVA